MRQTLQLIATRGGGVLRNHQAAFKTGTCRKVWLYAIHCVVSRQHPECAALANARNVAQRDLGLIHCKRQRHAVKISAAHNFESSGIINKNKRIVGDGAKFALHNKPRAIQLIKRRANHLRRTAKAVWILHARIIVLVRGWNIGARKKSAHGGGHSNLPRLIARNMNALIKRRVAGQARVHAHGGGVDGGATQCVDLLKCKRGARGHKVRAVEKRQSFLGFKLHRLQVGGFQRGVGADCFARNNHIAFAK